MTTFRAQIAFPADSALVRDEMVITPHFGGDDAQALANVLKANLIANTAIATSPFKIKIYDAQKAPPSYPLAFAEQTGTPKTTGIPREVSLCLSYYSTYNRPRYRGRLFLPACFLGSTAGVRPSAGQITAALGWAAIFTTGLPPNTNWVVYSPTAGQAYGVSDWWVDDEWDTVRSRGLRSTSRQVGERAAALDESLVPPPEEQIARYRELEARAAA
jgi:hypothetical protein